MTNTPIHLADRLLELMHQFVSDQTDTAQFIALYQQAWRDLRDSIDVLNISTSASEAFDSAFTACDCYRPQEASYRTAVDIDDDQLRVEIRAAYEKVVKE